MILVKRQFYICVAVAMVEVFVFAGAKPQVIPAIVCSNISLELCCWRIGSCGLSLGQCSFTWHCLPHIVLVSREQQFSYIDILLIAHLRKAVCCEILCLFVVSMLFLTRLEA
jgi:hypothetical protein